MNECLNAVFWGALGALGLVGSVMLTIGIIGVRSGMSLSCPPRKGDDT